MGVAPVYPDSSRSYAIRDATEVLIKYFIKDVKKHQSFGRLIVMVELDEELGSELVDYLKGYIENSLRKIENTNVVECIACEIPRGYTDGQQIVIEKGIPDQKTAAKIAVDLSIDTFFSIQIEHVDNKLLLTAKAFEADKQEVFWTSAHQVYAKLSSKKSFLMNLALGPGYVLKNSDSSKGVSLNGNVFVGERFYGIGRLGFGSSNLFAATKSELSHSGGPYFGMNINELMGIYWPWGNINVFLNPGYSIHKKTMGGLMRGGVFVELGNLTHLTAEYQMPIYSTNSAKKYPTSVVISYGFEFF